MSKVNNLLEKISIDKALDNNLMLLYKSYNSIYTWKKIKEKFNEGLKDEDCPEYLESLTQYQKHKDLYKLIRDPQILDYIKAKEEFASFKGLEPSIDLHIETRQLTNEDFNINFEEQLKNFTQNSISEETKLKIVQKIETSLNYVIEFLEHIHELHYEEIAPYGTFNGAKIKALIPISPELKLYKIVEKKTYIGGSICQGYLNALQQINKKFKCLHNGNIDEIDYVKIAEKFDEKLSDEDIKYQFCLPLFHSALSCGVRGIFKPLTNYLTTTGKDRLFKCEDLGSFLKQYIPTFATNLYIVIDPKLEKLENEAFIQKFSYFLYNLLNVAFLEEFDPESYAKISIALGGEYIKLDKNDFITKSMKSKQVCEKTFAGALVQSEKNTNYIKYCYYATEGGWEKYKNLPMWAFRRVEALKAQGGGSWGKVPLGKDLLTDQPITINLASNIGWWISLIAGSRSGKGVTTMAILGQAIGQGYPFIYLDCKPEMSIDIESWAINGNQKVCVIDGKSNAGLVHSHGPKYEQALAKLKDKTKEGDAFNKELLNSIIWTRAVEIFIDLARARAEYNRKGSVFKVLDNPDKDYIFNGNIHPLLVLDEYQAMSNIVAQFVNSSGATISKIVEDDKGNIKTESQKIESKLVDSIRKHPEAKDYLTKIQEWLQDVYTSKDGLQGELRTADGGQSGCNIFSIAQNVPKIHESDDTNYKGPLHSVLVSYLRFSSNRLYGTQTVGKTTLDVAESVKREAGIQGEIGRGQFIFKDPNGKTKAVKTYLCCNNAFDYKTLKLNMNNKNVYNAIKDGPQAVIEDVMEGGLNGTIRKDRKSVDTCYYIAEIKTPYGQEASLDTFYNNLGQSILYFDKFCNLLYGCSFYDRIYNIDDFICCDPVTKLNILKGQNNKDIIEKKKFERLAKVIYYNRHIEKENDLLNTYMNQDKEQE